MKKILFLVISILLSICLFSCNKEEEKYTIVSFHTELQEKLLNDEYPLYGNYSNGTVENSMPNAIIINIDNNDGLTHKLIISENKDLSDAKEYETTDSSISIYNLKANTKYYYQVDGGNTIVIKTSYGPRNLYIPSLTNVRDIGGYNVGKKQIKQNLIFRSSKFNADESSEVIISNDAINTLINEFKIKTEIDLRKVGEGDDNENGGITISPLGSSVNYISIPMKSGGNILTLNKNKIKDFFEVIGNKDNYPIVFHCSIGTDRTGAMAFLINGLLGASLEDLYVDFLFSNYGLIGSMRTASIIDAYVRTVETFGYDKLSDNIEAYLLSINVKQSDIDNVKKIMLG